jgi:hypothetical protein
VGFIASFAFSQGAVIWVYLSEVFPQPRARQGPKPGQPHALGDERGLIPGISAVAAASGRGAVCVLRRHDGAAILRGVVLVIPKPRELRWNKCRRRWGLPDDEKYCLASCSDWLCCCWARFCTLDWVWRRWRRPLLPCRSSGFWREWRCMRGYRKEAPKQAPIPADEPTCWRARGSIVSSAPFATAERPA